MTAGSSPNSGNGKRRPTSGRAGTPGELAAAKAAVAARRGGPAAVRASAGRWQAGLSALVGAVTGVLGIGVRDTLQSIQPAFALVLASLLTVSFVAAFAGTLLALQAGGGVPRLVKTTTAADDDDHLTAKSAARSLRIAILATSLAVLTLLGSLWVSWFAPIPEPALAVIETRDQSSCGTTEIVGGQLFVTAETGSVHVMDPAEIIRWDATDRCS